MIQQSSLAAYHSLKRVNTKREQVYQMIKSFPGCSDKDICHMLGWAINSVTPRRNELLKLEKIEYCTPKRQNGRLVNTYKVRKMVDVSKLLDNGNGIEYINVQMVEHGYDTAIIIDQGDVTIIDGRNKLKLKVEIKRQHYLWLLNKPSLEILKDKFGSDTKNWVGKMVQLTTKEWSHKGKSGKMIKPVSIHPIENSYEGVKLGQA